MEIKPENQMRLSAALENANDAFWEVIARTFPEAKAGDFPPDITVRREDHNKEDVLWWLSFNAPQLLVGHEEKAETPGEALKPGVYESVYGNAISWDGQTAFDLDMGEEVDLGVILRNRFIRPLD